jgi:hypothetical protein
MNYSPGDVHSHKNSILTRLKYTPQSNLPRFEAIVGVVGTDTFVEGQGGEPAIPVLKVGLCAMDVDLFSNRKNPPKLSATSGLKVLNDRIIGMPYCPKEDESVRAVLANFMGNMSEHTFATASFLGLNAVQLAMNVFSEHITASIDGEVIPVVSSYELIPHFVLSAWCGLLLPATE